MIICLLAIALFVEFFVGGTVLVLGGGWLTAFVVAQGAGCAAVLGAAFVGSGPQHIHETASANRAA